MGFKDDQHHPREVKSVLTFQVWCKLWGPWSFSLTQPTQKAHMVDLKEMHVGVEWLAVHRKVHGIQTFQWLCLGSRVLHIPGGVIPWCLHHWAKWASPPCTEGRADERIQMLQSFIVSKQKRAHMCRFINYCFH